MNFSLNSIKFSNYFQSNYATDREWLVNCNFVVFYVDLANLDTILLEQQVIVYFLQNGLFLMIDD